MYILNIEFASKEAAEAVQNYVNSNYNSSEVFWNALTEIKTIKKD